MPADAYQGLRDLAQAGHPAAMAYTAVLAGLGEGEPQAWTVALQRLAQAAELGSESAQGQLRVLSGRGGDDWPAMAEAVDLAPWLARAAPVRAANGVRLATVRRFLSAEVCEWLIARGRGRLSAAKAYSAEGSAAVHEERDNSAFTFMAGDLDLVMVLVRAKIANSAMTAPRQLEPPQLLRYAPGQRFLPHYDFLNPELAGHAETLAREGQRVMTFLVYLNEGYEGGETDFPRLGVRVKGKTGDALVFPNLDQDDRPDRSMLHAGLAPISGEKWLLSQWIREGRDATPASFV